MSFWDKLEKWATKLEESASNFEKKANEFLEKNFSEEESEQPTYTSQSLLSLVKSRIRKIAGDRLLAGLSAIDSRATKLYISRLSESDGVYDGLDIATATIEKTSSKHPKLSNDQYIVNLKGLVNGEDDYGVTAVFGKYEIVLVIDEHADYVIDTVDVTRRW